MDHRQVAADVLMKAGHTVKHIGSNGATEDRVLDRKLPDFILQEEEKLRKLEKMRQAGELRGAQKSSVDRSSESVASKLLCPPNVVDAMEELRAAGNQVELVRAQRKLARIQRLGDKHGILARKVLENTPQWILEEAAEQEAWISKKAAEKVVKSEGSYASCSHQQEAHSSTVVDDPDVECRRCGVFFPWSNLVKGDGCCLKCLTSAESFCRHQDVEGHSDTEGAAVLMVECAKCAVVWPWHDLQDRDGVCLRCVTGWDQPLQSREPFAPVQSQMLQQQGIASHGTQKEPLALGASHATDMGFSRAGSSQEEGTPRVTTLQCSETLRVSTWRARRRAAAAACS